MKPILFARLGYINSSSRVLKSLTKRSKFLRLVCSRFINGTTEQTMDAFLKALQRDYNGIVFDVCTTRDNELVCWHDDNIAPVASLNGKPLCGRWLISEHTIAEVLKLEIGIFRFGGGNLLQPSEILKFCYDNQLWAEIEIKREFNQDACKKLCDSISKEHMECMTIVHRNRADNNILETISKILPNVRLSRTANNRDAMQHMIDMKVPNQKIVTITNYKGRTPETLSHESLTQLKSNGLEIIFSEVKNKKEQKTIQPYLQSIDYLSTRII